MEAIPGSSRGSARPHKAKQARFGVTTHLRPHLCPCPLLPPGQDGVGRGCGGGEDPTGHNINETQDLRAGQNRRFCSRAAPFPCPSPRVSELTTHLVRLR